MAGRVPYPGDDTPLSDDEQRTWDNLTRELGPLTPLANPRDYTVVENPDDDAFVPPNPQLSPTPRRVVIPWLVLALAIVLAIVMRLAGVATPWLIVLLLAAGGAIVALLRQLPEHRADDAPQV